MSKQILLQQHIQNVRNIIKYDDTWQEYLTDDEKQSFEDALQGLVKLFEMLLAEVHMRKCEQELQEAKERVRASREGTAEPSRLTKR